jgi:putative Holliday junction resolvase
MNDKGRILCVDYGTTRIGIALSDPTICFAQAKDYIKNDCKPEELAARIAKLAIDNGAKKIVIGLPKKLDGSDGGASERIRALKDLISGNFPIDVILWDERFSTVSAEKTLIEANMSRKKRKEKIDSLAAVIILQNYLDFISRDIP